MRYSWDKRAPMPAPKNEFREYLQKAVNLALEDEGKEDGDNLKWILERTRKGVKKNWTDLQPQEFLEEYLWCVGGIRKRFTTRAKKYPDQVKLFRECDPKKVTLDAERIRSEWKHSKCDLNSRMLEAVLSTAEMI